MCLHQYGIYIDMYQYLYMVYLTFIIYHSQKWKKYKNITYPKIKFYIVLIKQFFS